MSNSWAEPSLTATQRVRRYNKEALIVCSDDSMSGDEVREIGSKRNVPRFPFSASKRQRISTTISMQRNSSLPSLNTSSSSTSAPVRIKSEAEIQALEDLQRKPPGQRVKIYVGKNNTEIKVRLEDLNKSPVLKCLISKLGTPGPYIMHPELTMVNAEHFQPVREFLLTDEYTPALVNNPCGEDVLPKQLDGCSSATHYRNEALRAGHLYVIAERLGMRALQGLVFRKITQAQFHQYSIKCLLDLAMIIFSRPEESELKRNSKSKRMEDDSRNVKGDVLENWLVESLKEQFQPAMIFHARQFFRVANHGACMKRAFGARVLRSKVDDWDALGPDVIAIEDDG